MDWGPGDLALCIKRGLWVGVTHGAILSRQTERPRAGNVYTVENVTLHDKGEVLYLRGLNQESGGGRWRFLSSRFVKVTPPEADQFDIETIDLMNSLPAAVG